MFAHINIDFNWKDEVLCYLNPSESFKSGKPVSSVNFHLWLHFSLKFDVLLKKIKVLICNVKETILKILLSNDYIIVYEDTEFRDFLKSLWQYYHQTARRCRLLQGLQVWQKLFKIIAVKLALRAKGYASKCLSTNFHINNLKNVLIEKQNWERILWDWRKWYLSKKTNIL